MRVFSAPILASVSQMAHLLESNGIDCEIRGEYRSGGAGEIPATEAWPELWVVDPGQVSEARAIIASALEDSGESGPPWSCPGCGESVDAQFGACWNCGHLNPDDGG